MRHHELGSSLHDDAEDDSESSSSASAASSRSQNSEASASSHSQNSEASSSSSSSSSKSSSSSNGSGAEEQSDSDDSSDAPDSESGESTLPGTADVSSSDDDASAKSAQSSSSSSSNTADSDDDEEEEDKAQPTLNSVPKSSAESSAVVSDDDEPSESSGATSLSDTVMTEDATPLKPTSAARSSPVKHSPKPAPPASTNKQNDIDSEGSSSSTSESEIVEAKSLTSGRLDSNVSTKNTREAVTLPTSKSPKMDDDDSEGTSDSDTVITDLVQANTPSATQQVSCDDDDDDDDDDDNSKSAASNATSDSDTVATDVVPAANSSTPKTKSKLTEMVQSMRSAKKKSSADSCATSDSDTVMTADVPATKPRAVLNSTTASAPQAAPRSPPKRTEIVQPVRSSTKAMSGLASVASSVDSGDSSDSDTVQSDNVHVTVATSVSPSRKVAFSNPPVSSTSTISVVSEYTNETEDGEDESSSHSETTESNTVESNVSTAQSSKEESSESEEDASAVDSVSSNGESSRSASTATATVSTNPSQLAGIKEVEEESSEAESTPDTATSKGDEEESSEVEAAPDAAAIEDKASTDSDTDATSHTDPNGIERKNSTEASSPGPVLESRSPSVSEGKEESKLNPTDTRQDRPKTPSKKQLGGMLDLLNKTTMMEDIDVKSLGDISEITEDTSAKRFSHMMVGGPSDAVSHLASIGEDFSKEDESSRAEPEIKEKLEAHEETLEETFEASKRSLKPNIEDEQERGHILNLNFESDEAVVYDLEKEPKFNDVNDSELSPDRPKTEPNIADQKSIPTRPKKNFFGILRRAVRPSFRKSKDDEAGKSLTVNEGESKSTVDEFSKISHSDELQNDANNNTGDVSFGHGRGEARTDDPLVTAAKNMSSMTENDIVVDDESLAPPSIAGGLLTKSPSRFLGRSRSYSDESAPQPQRPLPDENRRRSPFRTKSFDSDDGSSKIFGFLRRPKVKKEYSSFFDAEFSDSNLNVETGFKLPNDRMFARGSESSDDGPVSSEETSTDQNRNVGRAAPQSGNPFTTDSDVSDGDSRSTDIHLLDPDGKPREMNDAIFERNDKKSRDREANNKLEDSADEYDDNVESMMETDGCSDVDDRTTSTNRSDVDIASESTGDSHNEPMEVCDVLESGASDRRTAQAEFVDASVEQNDCVACESEEESQCEASGVCDLHDKQGGDESAEGALSVSQNISEDVSESQASAESESSGALVETATESEGSESEKSAVIGSEDESVFEVESEFETDSLLPENESENASVTSGDESQTNSVDDGDETEGSDLGNAKASMSIESGEKSQTHSYSDNDGAMGTEDDDTGSAEDAFVDFVDMSDMISTKTEENARRSDEEELEVFGFSNKRGETIVTDEIFTGFPFSAVDDAPVPNVDGSRDECIGRSESDSNTNDDDECDIANSDDGFVHFSETDYRQTERETVPDSSDDVNESEYLSESSPDKDDNDGSLEVSNAAETPKSRNRGGIASFGPGVLNKPPLLGNRFGDDDEGVSNFHVPQRSTGLINDVDDYSGLQSNEHRALDSNNDFENQDPRNTDSEMDDYNYPQRNFDMEDDDEACHAEKSIKNRRWPFQARKGTAAKEHGTSETIYGSAMKEETLDMNVREEDVNVHTNFPMDSSFDDIEDPALTEKRALYPDQDQRSSRRVNPLAAAKEKIKQSRNRSTTSLPQHDPLLQNAESDAKPFPLADSDNKQQDKRNLKWPTWSSSRKAAEVRDHRDTEKQLEPIFLAQASQPDDVPIGDGATQDEEEHFVDEASAGNKDDRDDFDHRRGSLRNPLNMVRRASNWSGRTGRSVPLQESSMPSESSDNEMTHLSELPKIPENERTVPFGSDHVSGIQEPSIPDYQESATYESSPSHSKLISPTMSATKTKGPGRFNCRCCIFLALAIGGLILGVAIANVLILQSNNEKAVVAAVDVPTPAPVVATVGAPIAPNATSPIMGHDDVYNLLCSVMKDCSPLSDPTTPQGTAFAWLVDPTTNPALDSYSSDKKITRYALAALYHGTQGESWVDNSNWLTPMDECDWYSTASTITATPPPTTITATTTTPVCNEVGDLIALELDNNGLDGLIPADMGLLTSLTRLSLQKPNSDTSTVLGGRLDSFLGGLEQLTALAITGNTLNGGIPSDIAKLTLLQRLDLSSNNLSGDMPVAMQALSNLQYLNLGGNKLTGGIQSELLSLASSNLVELDLAGNMLTSVPDTIATLSNLRRLNLRDNDLILFPVAVQSLHRTLEVLDLSLNRFGGPVPLVVGALTQLRELQLSGNDFTGTIPTELGQLRALNVTLDLSENRFSGPIPFELSQLVNLQRFYVQFNALTGPIPPEFVRMKEIRTIRLDHNNLTGTVPLLLCGIYDVTQPVAYADCDELGVGGSSDCFSYCCTELGGCVCRFESTDFERCLTA